jgi:Ca2+-transporting ATPase
MAYILAIHVPIADLSLLPVLFGWLLIFFPVQIAFLELIIDPVCSIVFEAEREESNTMRRPPPPPDEPLFSAWNLALSLLQGVGVLILAIAMFGIGLERGLAEGAARALAFTTLVVANIALIFANRSLWLVTGAAVLCLALVLQVPALRDLFQFAPLDGGSLLLAVVVGLVSVAWFELFKVVRKPRLA